MPFSIPDTIPASRPDQSTQENKSRIRRTLCDPWLQAVRRLQKEARRERTCTCRNDRVHVCEHVWREAVEELLSRHEGTKNQEAFLPELLPAEATKAPAGSAEKIHVMRQRYKKRLSTSHPDDPFYDGGNDAA